MEMQQHGQVHEVDNLADIELSKPSKSRFLFLLSFFSFFIFAWAGCYSLWEHGYKSNEKAAAPESSLYTPKYK